MRQEKDPAAEMTIVRLQMSGEEQSRSSENLWQPYVVPVSPLSEWLLRNMYLCRSDYRVADHCQTPFLDCHPPTLNHNILWTYRVAEYSIFPFCSDASPR
jgi:hypothetical protein